MLQAAKILNGAVDKLGSLSAGQVFNSILPRVNLDFGSQQSQPDPNAEILAAQKSYFDSKAEAQQAEVRTNQLETQQAAGTVSASSLLRSNESLAVSEGGTAALTANPEYLPSQNTSNPAQDFSGIDEPNNSKDLTSFVKSFEGFVANATPDGRQTSIGYGTKARPGERTISRADAEVRLNQEINSHRSRVQEVAQRGGYQFSDTQIDALTSFDYNTGRASQLLLENGRRRFSDNNQIAQKLLEYDKANLDGKGLRPYKGLTRRRRAEAQIFLNDSY